MSTRKNKTVVSSLCVLFSNCRCMTVIQLKIVTAMRLNFYDYYLKFDFKLYDCRILLRYSFSVQYHQIVKCFFAEPALLIIAFKYMVVLYFSWLLKWTMRVLSYTHV